MQISQKELREICILSGTDYNINFGNNNFEPTLYTTLKHFKKFKKENNGSEFYNWLNQNTDYIKDIELLEKINSIFNLNCQNYNLEIFKSIKIVNGPIIKNDIKEILKADGFIFPLL